MKYKHDYKKLKKEKHASRQADIAIVGMACRFPGAKNYDEFWHNLATGVNSISTITKDRWDIDQYYSPNNDSNRSVSK